MKNNFSPSVNIIRDQNKELTYIPTANAERVIEYLNKNISRGIKSFYLVGSYGTGKSSFLLALEKQIYSTGQSIFKTPISFNGTIKYKPINLIGDYCSFEEALRKKLDINSKKDIIEALNNTYEELHNKKKGLLIAIDEFGKFLEYASQNNPEKELYLMQKLAEFSNDTKKNIVLLTTLHQGFDSYRSKIRENVRNEWDKVKGRLVEIPFNEPVEQLLYLAAESIAGKIKRISRRKFDLLFKTIIDSRVYPLNNNLNEKLAENLFPLDLISAGILAKSLQKYGQNERSLFTFLETNNPAKQSSLFFFNLSNVYDYLINNYYSFLSSKHNPDYFKWTIIKNSIERVESLFERNSSDKEKIIKAIGLLNIFAHNGSKINLPFLESYGDIALNIKDVGNELKILETKRIIRYRAYSESYILFEGTDIDLDLSLSEAENHISHDTNIIGSLREYFDLPCAIAKTSYIKTGTPRFFDFIISEEPIKDKPVGEIDGFINMIFNKSISLENVKNFSKECKEAILFVLNHNTVRIDEIILDIKKVNFVLNSTTDDRVVQRELKGLKGSLISELNSLVFESLFENTNKIVWFFAGEEREIKSKVDFNNLLSEIIDIIYPLTPIFKNELINREKIPAAITTARRSLISNLLLHSSEENLDYPANVFPPDKTIYLSLLKNTKIHYLKNGEWHWKRPSEESFKNLWDYCDNWFETSKNGKKAVLELYEILNSKPFKLKQGFLDFWIPLFLFIRRDDYAIFEGETYIPEFSNDLIDLLIRKPENYFIKAFNLKGLKIDLFKRYRDFINKSSEIKITNKIFIETLKPFFVLYRQLPEYTKKTQRLSNTALALRESILKSKDPEKTFFEDFPQALGYSVIELFESDNYLKGFVNQLQNNIKELRTNYGDLVNRVESKLLEIFDLINVPFPDYKKLISQKYNHIKKHLLLPYQKTFLIRLQSELDDKFSWLSSLTFPLVEKNLDKINDIEEELIYTRLENIFSELNNLCEISTLDIDFEKEEVIGFEITPIAGRPQKGIIRIPIKDFKESSLIEEGLRKKLTKDKRLNKYLLLKLFKEQLEND